MSRRWTTRLTAGLVIGACAVAAAQVRDRPRPDSAQFGSIQGRVEIDMSGRRGPVRHAHVTLSADAGGSESTTATDTDGRYRFDRVSAGRYRIRAEKAGFVPALSDPGRPGEPSAPTPIAIRLGEMATVDLPMQRAGALAGQFLDDQGRPIAHLTVTADRLLETPDRRGVAEPRWATTDDLGRFRLHTLWPGRYVLRATPPPPASGGELYFPGVADASRAAVLTLVAGQTIDRLDFQVAAAPLSAIAADALAAHEPEPTKLSGPEATAARVAGHVTRSDTGAPIEHATVRMRAAALGGSGDAARTDERGQFEFTGVPAGSYLLTATADGYVALDGSVVLPEGAGTRILVKEREQVETADVALAPPGAIEGFVLDEFGDPAPAVSVQWTQAIHAAGLPVFMPGRGDTSTGPTDDRGWFRMSGLFPGDYYLVALPESLRALVGGFGGGPASAGTADDSSAGFAATFFPGTDSVDAAAPVHVAPGAEVPNATFGLVGARLATISGVVTDLVGQPASNTRVMLIQTHAGSVRTIIGSVTTSAANGSFRFPSVPEGTYVLQGFDAGRFGSLPIAPVATLPPAPFMVTLTLRPLTTARGHVSFDGNATPPHAPATVTIGFQPTDFLSGPIGSTRIVSRIDEGWNFEIPNLAWQGVIRVFAPEGWLLKSVLLDGRDIADTPYDFRSGDVSGLEIILTSRLGAVNGTVIEAGRPTGDASVILFPENEAAWPFPSRLVTLAQPDRHGALSAGKLLPGRYLAIAVPRVSSPLIDPARLRALRPFATPIEVSEGSGRPLTLTIVRR